MSHSKWIIAGVILAVTQDVFSLPRIAFGDKSEGYPFMVFLNMKVARGRGRGRCGGTLIKSNWVLTAAHCAVTDHRKNEPKQPESFTVHMGSVKERDGYAGAVKRVIVHARYNRPQFLDNDIALLELVEDVPADKGAPVRLAETLPEDKYAGQEALVVGWGLTERNRPSPVLLEGKIPLVADSACNAYFGGGSPEGKVCSVAQDEQARTGRGDSGGPVLVDADGRLVQIGLVSHGRTYVGNGTKYSVFTSTGYQHDWIEEHTAAVGYSLANNLDWGQIVHTAYLFG